MNIMAEVGLVKIHHGNKGHWDCLKIMRANEIERAFSICSKPIRGKSHRFVDDSCYSRYILKTNKCLPLNGKIYHGIMVT